MAGGESEEEEEEEEEEGGAGELLLPSLEMFWRFLMDVDLRYACIVRGESEKRRGNKKRMEERESRRQIISNDSQPPRISTSLISKPSSSLATPPAFGCRLLG